MRADAFGSKRPEAGTHKYHAGRANSRSDLAVEKSFDEVRAAAGRELNQCEHHREKQCGEEPKSHTRKRSFVDLDVRFQGAPLAFGKALLCVRSVEIANASNQPKVITA